MKKALIAFITIVITICAFGHGYQEVPMSRTDYLVKEGRTSEIAYNPQQVASLLRNGHGLNYASKATAIINYNNGGTIGFFKRYHKAQGNNVCSNTLPYNVLLQTPPDNALFDYPNTISYGSEKDFQWKLTAPHSPSIYFVFMTQYKKGEYKPDPSWNDLNLVCNSGIEGMGMQYTDNFKCKIPVAPANVANLNSRQVMVTLWQRMDSAGENFISCADVKMDQGQNPEPDLWKQLSSNDWLFGLNNITKNDKIIFSLYKNNQIVKTYEVKASEMNWEQKLSLQINNDIITDNSGLVNIGVLNHSTNSITYDPNVNNFVYLNSNRADKKSNYKYELTKVINDDPVLNEWGSVGMPIHHHLHNIKNGDKLTFILSKNGQPIEDENSRTSLIVDANNADMHVFEKQFANLITNHNYSGGEKITVGVLKDDKVNFVDGGENTINLRKETLGGVDYLHFSYDIVQKSTPHNPSDYPVYPENRGKYQVGKTVVVGSDGKLYKCKPFPHGAWCNINSSLYYEPGKGLAWRDAWEELK